MAAAEGNLPALYSVGKDRAGRREAEKDESMKIS